MTNENLRKELSNTRDYVHRIIQATQPELHISDAEFKEVALIWSWKALNAIDAILERLADE